MQKIAEVGGKKKIELKRIEALDGLSVPETIFVHEYVRNGGNATKAIMKAYEKYNDPAKYDAVRVQATRMLAKSNVASGLAALLKREFSENYVKSKFLKLSGDDQEAEIQFKSTREIGRILGMYGEGGGVKSGVQINVNFGLPPAGRTGSKPIDADAEEVEE